jgi:hypothetical protein
MTQGDEVISETKSLSQQIREMEFVKPESIDGLDIGLLGTGGTLIGLGQNWLPTRAKPIGSTPGTSLASRFFRNLATRQDRIGEWLRKPPPSYLQRVPTGHFFNMKSPISLTRAVAFGRVVPYLGWALTITDVIRINFPHMQQHIQSSGTMPSIYGPIYIRK